MSRSAVQVTTGSDPQLGLVPDDERFVISAAPVPAADGSLGTHLAAPRRGVIVPFPGRLSRGGVRFRRPGGIYPFAKRTLGVMVAFIAIVLLLPVLVAVALAIRATSLGPFPFRQERCGSGGRTFRLIKFRTMVSDAERIRHEVADFLMGSRGASKGRAEPPFAGDVCGEDRHPAV